MKYISGFDRKSFRWQRYGVAVLAVAIALLLKLLLEPSIKVKSPFFLFFAVVLVSACYGGMAAGVLSIVASALLSAYFLLTPTYSFGTCFWASGVVTASHCLNNLVIWHHRD